MRCAHLIGVLGVMTVVASLGARANPTPRQLGEADRYCRFGNQALKSGNLSKARGLFEKALKVFPSFPDAHTGMGHVAMASRKFEEALAEYNLASSAYVEFSDALFDLQLLHFDQAQDRISKLRDEISGYRRLLSAQPFGNSAVLDRKITELEQEIQQLEQTRSPALDPRKREAPGEVHFYIGNALFNLLRLDEALRAWETCAHLTPRFPLVYNNLAVAYWKQGHPDKALNSLSRAESLGLPVNSRFRADLERSASQQVSATLTTQP